MPVKFTDNDIEQMTRERKPLPENYRDLVKLRDKRGHKERELDIYGDSGNQYQLILRQNLFNNLDFSIILAVIPPNSNQIFRLRRYNGKSHQHTNLIEGDTFYDFHIHKATERYQEIGAREDSYAEPTDKYSDYYSALQGLLQDSAFDPPKNDQLLMFGRFDL
jgi:hypothetical protein